MAVDATLIDYVAECLAPIGSVTSRKMMGGATLYCDGTIFAILAGDALWFKSDATSDPVWEEQGCEKFTYDFGNGRTGSMNYRRAPDDVYDDPDALRHCAALALEASARAPVKRPRKPRGARPERMS